MWVNYGKIGGWPVASKRRKDRYKEVFDTIDYFIVRILLILLFVVEAIGLLMKAISSLGWHL